MLPFVQMLKRTQFLISPGVAAAAVEQSSSRLGRYTSKQSHERIMNERTNEQTNEGEQTHQHTNKSTHEHTNSNEKQTNKQTTSQISTTKPNNF